MISHETLNIEWLRHVSGKNRKADITLIEKVSRALILLETLALSDLRFVFKGGTALMLLLGSTKRLSIDIDIIVNGEQNIDEILVSLIPTYAFQRYELQPRKTEGKIKKAHYKFFYQPVYRTSLNEDHIILDVLFEEPVYKKLVSWNIDSNFLKQEGQPAKVIIPTAEGLLGDKLTAFAPNTTGIPFEKNGISQAMEIIKQLYDIGCLFDIAKDFGLVKETFDIFVEIESGYRDIGVSPEAVLEEIFQTSISIATKGSEGRETFDKLKDGIKSVGAFIFSEPYHIDRAVTDVSKLAYLTQSLLNSHNGIERFSDPLEIKEWIIEQPFNTKLNKLKKTNPEAFFYWYKTFQIMPKNDNL